MCATVTTGKLAAAFNAANGNRVFVLFEETYEKNCFPHYPNWSCRYIGPIEGALQRIFERADGCEGGSLQNRGGYITPEGYIAGWLKELAEPIVFDDRPVTVPATNIFYASSQMNFADVLTKVLADFGRQDIISAFRAKQIANVSLYENVDLVCALYRQVEIPPWRLIPGAPAASAPRSQDLGYNPTPAKDFAIEVPNVLRAGSAELLVQGKDGAWRASGWAYDVMGRFINGLWEAELREPGSYRQRIKACRDACRKAPNLPQGTKVVVDISVPLEDEYQSRAVSDFAQAHPVTRTTTGYEIAVQQNEQFLWAVCGLPKACTSWVLPEQPNSQREQMNLFAA